MTSEPNPGRRGWPTPPAPTATDHVMVEAMLDAIRTGRLDAWLARIRIATVMRMETDDYVHPNRPGG